MVLALAIHVGVDQYQEALNVRTLVACETDASLMAQATSAFTPVTVDIFGVAVPYLKDSDATVALFQKAISAAAARFVGEPEGYLLITFSGHGVPFSSEFGRGWCLFDGQVPSQGSQSLEMFLSV